VGGYSDWVRQRPAPERTSAPAATPKRVVTTTQAPRAEKKRRLTFKETHELAALPDRIDTLERDRERLYASLADPVVLRDGAAVADAKARLATLDVEINETMARWEELETIAAGG
jgi:ATP-binding cassette subfamily F protein uup